MQRSKISVPEHEILEYHGSTIVERILVIGGGFPRRDWLLFDTVEEAENFYNENRVADAQASWGRKC